MEVLAACDDAGSDVVTITSLPVGSFFVTLCREIRNAVMRGCGSIVLRHPVSRNQKRTIVLEIEDLRALLRLPTRKG
jgi:hypothetical protein